MARRGKQWRGASTRVSRATPYTLDEAVALVPQSGYATFDETVELAVRLGVDPKKPDQMVRGAVVLPHGLGKAVRVLVFAKGDKEKEALDAGADYVGQDDLMKKIQDGWLEFDQVIATPDMMGGVGRLGKILGPRGLMPNPKVGTVTFDVGRAVREAKAGRVEFRVDKTGNVHVPVGKRSFPAEKLRDNVATVLDQILRAKPSASKGAYIRSATLATTMGPGIRLDPAQVVSAVRAVTAG